MNLPWPGALTAATPRASVAVTADGARWLRAYATLPHPNILGGVVLVYLGGVIERYLRAGRWWWLGAAALGGLTLALTFSRAAWLGAVVMELALLVWVRAPHSAGMRRLTAAAVIVILIGVLPLLPFFLARTTSGGAGIAVEQNSINDRARLIRAGLDLIRSHPWLGVGAGNFVLALSPESYPGMPLEPVHNVILLTAAETGLPGALALAALMAAIALRLWRRRRSAGLAETVWASALIGVLVTALLDHFWWSLPPARTLLVILLALWAGSGPGDALTAAARPDAPSSTYGGFLTH
jgi:O-antigen ligase